MVEKHPSLDALFQMAWKTDTSPKVHHFLWRCLSNSLPIAGNLTKRHIAKDASCSRCGHEEESINHLLFLCPLARLVWALSPIPAPPDGIATESLYANLFHVLNLEKQYPSDDVPTGLVPWLLWRLWKNRNEFIFTGKEYEAESVLRKAQEDAEEWRDRKKAEMKEVNLSGQKGPSNIRQKMIWRPPKQNWLKYNSDGAWHQHRENSGVGWICRNERGQMLWAGAKVEKELRSSIEAEAEALRWGAEMMTVFRYTNIIFETDSLTLAKMLNGEEEVWPKLQPTIDVIHQSLSQI